MQIKMGKLNQQLTLLHFFFSSFWVAALLINMELNCCCFRLTRVIRATEVQCVCAHRHTIGNSELYIGKTSSLSSPRNLNNMAAVSIIDSCKASWGGREKVVNFSVHQTFFGFSFGGRNLPGGGRRVVEVWEVLFCFGGSLWIYTEELHKEQ